MISIEKLKKYANNLEFDMKESEYETLRDEFEILFKQMELIDSIPDIEKYSPMSFPFKLEDAYLRSDEVTMSLDKKDALANSKDTLNDSVKVPKVVE